MAWPKGKKRPEATKALQRAAFARRRMEGRKNAPRKINMPDIAPPEIIKPAEPINMKAIERAKPQTRKAMFRQLDANLTQLLALGVTVRRQIEQLSLSEPE